LFATTVALLTIATASSASAQSWYWSDTHDYASCGTTDDNMGYGVAVSPGYASSSFSVATAGEIDCRSVSGRYCTGYFYHHPVEIDVLSRTNVEIEVTWANVDTVLALVGPSGVFADDDGGSGTNSKITAFLSPGRYLLYTGTYGYGASGQMTVAVGEAAPMYSGGYGHDGHGGHDGHAGHGGHGGHHGHDSHDDSHGASCGCGACSGHGGSHATPPHVSRPTPHVTRRPSRRPTRGGLAGSCPAHAELIRLDRHGHGARIRGMARGRIDATERVGFGAAGWLPRRAQACVVIEEA